MNIGNGFAELLGKVCPLVRNAGGFGTETPRHHFHLSEYHFGMLNKVAVHQDTVFIRAELYPIQLYIHNAVTLLQNENVRHDLCSGIALEGVIRQTDSADEISSLGNILADSGVFLVHRAFACDQCHHAARTELVQGLCEEIIVNQKVVLVVPLVCHLEISKRHIADDTIKKAVR